MSHRPLPLTNNFNKTKAAIFPKQASLHENLLSQRIITAYLCLPELNAAGGVWPATAPASVSPVYVRPSHRLHQR